jgi:hypothetical protein
VRGDQVEQFIGIFRPRGRVRIGDTGEVVLEDHVHILWPSRSLDHKMALAAAAIKRAAAR